MSFADEMKNLNGRHAAFSEQELFDDLVLFAVDRLKDCIRRGAEAGKYKDRIKGTYGALYFVKPYPYDGRHFPTDPSVTGRVSISRDDYDNQYHCFIEPYKIETIKNLFGAKARVCLTPAGRDAVRRFQEFAEQEGILTQVYFRRDGKRINENEFFKLTPSEAESPYSHSYQRVGLDLVVDYEIV